MPVATQRIEVAVRLGTDRLIVIVQDDGEDALPPGPDSFGIVAMQERTALLGGSFVAQGRFRKAAGWFGLNLRWSTNDDHPGARGR